MNVKFRKYKKKDGSTSLNAILVRSFRHGVTGKPYSQYVTLIQTIAEKDCKNVVAQIRFWHRLENLLARLPITETEKTRVRRSASRRVPFVNVNNPNLALAV
jgi:hypothetical protein